MNATSVSSALQSTAQVEPKSDLRKAAEAFEAIFLRQWLASARSADFGGDGLFGGAGTEQFTAMRDENFADIASRQGVFGLADAIERQLSAQPKAEQ